MNAAHLQWPHLLHEVREGRGWDWSVSRHIWPQLLLSPCHALHVLGFVLVHLRAVLRASPCSHSESQRHPLKAESPSYLMYLQTIHIYFNRQGGRLFHRAWPRMPHRGACTMIRGVRHRHQPPSAKTTRRFSQRHKYNDEQGGEPACSPISDSCRHFAIIGEWR